jgi:hypothetical protein
MAFSSRTTAHLARVIIMLFLAFTMPLRAATSTSACNWVNSAYNEGIHYGDVDIDAQYYSMLIRSPAAGVTGMKIEGAYPAARNFSFIAYKGSSSVMDAISDYQITPDPGNASPFTDVVHIDPAVAPGGRYTVNIVFSAKPDEPAPNTLYLDPQVLATRGSVLIYRIYNPSPGGTDPGTGGVGLPTIVEVTDSGDVPIGSLPTSWFCQGWTWMVQVNGPNTIETLSNLDLFKFPTSSRPRFYLNRGSTGLPLEAINVDNRYTGVTLSQPLGDMALLRGRAPFYTTQPGVEPQVRHWSICENNMVGLTYGCVEDYSAAIDQDGFFNVVVSLPDKKPANATHDFGFDWLTYGTGPTPSVGVIIYRQTLASPDFKQSMDAVEPGQSAASVMGDYLPKATYCSSAVFDAQTAAHASPAAVFAACKAASQ